MAQKRRTLCTALKENVQRRQALIVPGAPNALTARLVEDLGFEAVYITGAGVTNMHLGVPDIGLITLTELADHVGAIRDVVSLPLIVDADTGFGNPVNVTRTVKVLERSGANGIQLEDQAFPKRCGHFSGKSVIPVGEMVQKLKAATDTRRDPDLQIIARTDALAKLGINAALDRAAAYVESGADMTFVDAPENVGELRAVASALKVPQVANMVVGGKTPLVGRSELIEMGFAVVLYANAALQSALYGMQTVLSELYKEGSLETVRELLTPFSERQRLAGKTDFDALEEKYQTEPETK